MNFDTEFHPVTTQPQEIEAKSFEMIAEELGPHSFTHEQFPVVQRVIHASADFELGRSLVFHPDAVQAGLTNGNNGSCCVKRFGFCGYIRIGDIDMDLSAVFGDSWLADPRLHHLHVGDDSPAFTNRSNACLYRIWMKY